MSFGDSDSAAAEVHRQEVHAVAATKLREAGFADVGDAVGPVCPTCVATAARRMLEQVSAL